MTHPAALRLRRLLLLLLATLAITGCPAGASPDDQRDHVLWFLPPIDRQEGNRPVPLVVMLEGQGGTSLTQRSPWVSWFLDRGIAVAQMRSAALRGRHDWLAAGCTLGYAIDARDVLELARHEQPRIDTTRFALLGSGRGGTEALNSASYFGRDGLAMPAAVFAFAPGCAGWCPVDYAPDGQTDIHIFYGQDDPWGRHRDTLDRCRAQAGGRIATHIIPGAGHGFEGRSQDVQVIDGVTVRQQPNAIAAEIARSIVWQTLALAWTPPPYTAGMADVINLNKARKALAKQQQKAQAAANRVSFGTSKVSRTEARKDAERAAKDLDGKKIED